MRAVASRLVLGVLRPRDEGFILTFGERGPIVEAPREIGNLKLPREAKSMQKVRILVLVCAMACAAVVAAPSYGQGGPVVFVSSFSGEQILRIDGTTGATTAIFTGSPGFRPEDIAVGPDNKVYVCDPSNNRIIRMDDNGSNVENVYPSGLNPLDPLRPQGPRFDALGNLYFNTKGSTHSGIWKIAGVANIPTGFPIPAPVNVLTAAQTGSAGGEGLAFANNGDLLIVDASNDRVRRSFDPGFTVVDTIIPTTSGLDDPTGIARDSGNSSNPNGRIYVANGGALNNIVRCDDDGSPCTTFVSFGPNDRPFYFEIALDNTLFVATSDHSLQNGKLWRVSTAGVKTLVKALPKRKGKFPPAIGLALAATSRSITLPFSSSITTQTFDFGGFYWEMTNFATAPCDAAVTAQQKTPAEVANLLSTNFATSTALTFKGEGGFVIVFLATQPGCFSGPTSVYAAAYIANALSLNPRMIRNYVEPLELFRYDPISSLPGDPGMGANTNNFSEFVMVDQAVEAGQAAFFCGFESPLNPDGSSTFNSGKTIAVKFRLSTSEGCTSDFVTDAQALISVVKLFDESDMVDYQRKVADPSGDSNTPPEFRNGGSVYIYDLQLTGYTPGTYLISVVFLTNNTTVHTIEFNVVD